MKFAVPISICAALHPPFTEGDEIVARNFRRDLPKKKNSGCYLADLDM